MIAYRGYGHRCHEHHRRDSRDNLRRDQQHGVRDLQETSERPAPGSRPESTKPVDPLAVEIRLAQARSASRHRSSGC